jgi:hypothetical protein
MLRRPTGGKAVLHGHDLTVALVFRYVALTPSPSPTQWERGAEPALTPSPLPRSGRREPSLPSPPSPSPTGRERGVGAHSRAPLHIPHYPRAGEGDTGGEGNTNTRPTPARSTSSLRPR